MAAMIVKLLVECPAATAVIFGISPGRDGQEAIAPWPPMHVELSTLDVVTNAEDKRTAVPQHVFVARGTPTNGSGKNAAPQKTD
jgi:hypothetical protein